MLVDPLAALTLRISAADGFLVFFLQSAHHHQSCGSVPPSYSRGRFFTVDPHFLQAYLLTEEASLGRSVLLRGSAA
jgi:hypothetical protein